MVIIIKLLHIKGFEGLYGIDEYGNVYSLVTTKSRRKGILKPYLNSGYLRVNLYDITGKCKKRYVHRLVAETFIPNPTNLPVINHKDANKENNYFGNLEWCTQKENIDHSFEMELQPKSLPTYVDGNRFKTMKDASLSIGLRHFRIAHERRERGNEFMLYGHHVKVGDAECQR